MESPQDQAAKSPSKELTELQNDKPTIQETTVETKDVDVNQLQSKHDQTEKDQLPQQQDVIVPIIQETYKGTNDVDVNQLKAYPDLAEKDELQPKQDVIVPLMQETYKGEMTDFIMDAEAGVFAEESSFSASVRLAFIRKVYCIMTVQLAITAAIIALFTSVDEVREWTYYNEWSLYVAIAIVIVIIVTLACCDSISRRTPGNFICLGIFTLAFGYMLGAIVCRFDVEAILLAVGICAVITLTLTIFSFQTKLDVTKCGGVLCVLMIILLFTGIAFAFFPQDDYATIGYSAAGALIFSLYIVYDTQMMLGNKKHSISPEDYVFAALNLYLDVINLFLRILIIISKAQKK